MTTLEKVIISASVLIFTAGACWLIMLCARVLAGLACVVLCVFAVRVLLESTS